jgi:uncharacterized cupredoxin-like copper-binding protein
MLEDRPIYALGVRIMVNGIITALWTGLWRLGLILTLFWVGLSLPAVAATSLAQQPATELQVTLGNPAGELKFIPDTFKLAANKRYKLVLTNPSPVKHYFTAKDFADAIWTQKVDAGNVEIKGAIHELELRPGSRAEWVFVTLRPGDYSLRCTIPGHTKAGMIGKLTIG